MKKLCICFGLITLFWIVLTSCSHEIITIQSDYLSHENLASYHVGTPDPLLNHPPIGQRLIVSWSLPKKYRELTDLQLHITIRFRNREEVMENVQLLNRSGTYIYSLLNDDYFNKEGILTYKIDIYAGSQLLEEWRHQIWTDLIQFDCD